MSVCSSPSPPSPSLFRGGGTRGCALLACGANACQHLVEARDHVAIGEAQDEQVTPGQDLVAGAVIVRLMQVNPSVEFDDDSGCMAIEVGNEAVNHLLTTPVQAVQLVGTQVLPQARLLWRHVAPQCASARLLDAPYRPPGDNPVMGRRVTAIVFVIDPVPLMGR